MNDIELAARAREFLDAQKAYAEAREKLQEAIRPKGVPLVSGDTFKINVKAGATGKPAVFIPYNSERPMAERILLNLNDVCPRAALFHKFQAGCNTALLSLQKRKLIRIGKSGGVSRTRKGDALVASWL